MILYIYKQLNMRKILIFAVIVTALVSCTSRSGNRPKGPKTFLTTRVISTRLENRFILVDKNNDGKPDEELVNTSGKAFLTGDSVTLILQEGFVTGFYKH